MAINKESIQGVIFALVGCVGLGILGIVDKVGTLESNNPFVFSTQSLLFSLLFTLIFALFYFKGLPIRKISNLSISSLGLIILVGVFASGIFILLRFIGLTESTGTFATLSQIVTTSLTAVFAWFILKEQLSKSFWGLFIVIILSMYFVSVGSLTLASVKSGDIYILFGAIFLAVANIFSRIGVQKVDPILFSLGRFIFGSIFLLITGLLLVNNYGILNSFTGWVILSGLLWAINVIAFNLAIKRIGVTFTTSLLMMAPIITILLEYSLLKHHFTFVQVAAALVVVAGGLAIILHK
ncbi:MAG: DMT family transporter, partial [Patescibacteria group bacterium]